MSACAVKARSSAGFETSLLREGFRSSNLLRLALSIGPYAQHAKNRKRKAMKRTFKFEIDGKPWKWVYKSLKKRKAFGICDWQNKTVAICTSCDGLERLDTECHEALHATQGFASEDHVTQVANTLSKILWELGYRISAPDSRQ